MKKTRRKNTSGDPVTQYAKDVVAGKIIAGRPVRLACQRHLRDLKEGPKRGLKWDLAAARDTIKFFSEALYLTGEKGEAKPFVLERPLAFIVGSLYGWRGQDGYRRFRVAFVEMAKGNAKSPLAAGIGNYMLVADGEARAEVYAAAADKDQARVIFRDSVAMAKASPVLAGSIQFSGGEGREWNMAYLRRGSFFRPISSENKGRGKSGFRVHCGLLDEIHEHSTSAMVEFLRANTKGRRQALILMTTNSGFDRQSVCYHYHDYSLKILEGTEENDSFFAYVCSLDPCEECRGAGFQQPNDNCNQCDDWRDEKVWLKANPMLSITPGRKYLREQVREAIGMPSKQSLVRRLNFCQWMESVETWIDPEAWKANGGSVDPAELRGKLCYGGLDLSGKNDLTSLELVFPLEDSKAVLSFFWTPKDTLLKREEQDRAPYSQWVREGHLMTTPGKTIDYAWVAQKIGEISTLYDIATISFDRWRIDDLRRELDAIGVDVLLVPHGQGFKDINPAIEALEDDLLENRLKHGNHPVLTYCVANAITEMDAAGLRKFSKRSARGRIDGAVALAMAESAACRNAGTGKSIWDSDETAVM